MMKKGNNIILTIGIDKYDSDIWVNLNNAVFDCESLVSTVCERYSFERSVDSLVNAGATNKNIHRSFNTLRNAIDENDNVIIFFAGHGNMNPQTRRGYWIPYDGTSDPSTWIDNSVIKNYIEDLNCRHIWLIVDACFSGLFLSKTRGYGGLQQYAELYEKQSRWVLASGREEKVSDGGKGSHSPFCKALLEFLEMNENKYCCVSEIIEYVKTITENTSRQIPMGSYITNIGHEGGELILELNHGLYRTELSSTVGIPSSPILRSNMGKYKKNERNIPSGKEILLIKLDTPDHDFIIFENFRFDDNGNKKLSFRDDHVTLSNDTCFNLVQRFSTVNGLYRYIERNDSHLKTDKKIPFIPANKEIEDVEDSLLARGHAIYLKRLLDSNSDIMKCLHCGEKVSTNDGYLIEVDEIGLVENVGNVHAECLRPSDRIIGYSGYPNLSSSVLRNFDFKSWGEILESGQGLIAPIYNGINKLPPVCNLLWNEKHSHNVGKYCIREYFDNGEIRYVKRGKEIERFTETEIEDTLKIFNESLRNDSRIYMVVETKVYGSLDYIERVKEENQTIIAACKYEKCLYSKQLESEMNNKIKNNYAPLALVESNESKQILCISNIVPIISKIEEFEAFTENWKYIIGELEGLSIRILKDDQEVDAVIKDLFNDDLSPIINPIFDEENRLKSGVIIISKDELVENRSKDKNLHKDDSVRLLFPELGNTGRFPVGKLVSDVFTDQHIGDCVIFQPMEDGKPSDMQYRVPVSIVEKL